MAAEERDMNRDPITDEPGAHPVGTGIGATGGAIAGATAGAIGGPIGVAVGGVVGAVVGGLAGKAAGEAVNPTAEEAYWRDNYSREPYYEQGRTFDLTVAVLPVDEVEPEPPVSDGDRFILTVLGAEGFLPGYGSYEGGVTASARRGFARNPPPKRGGRRRGNTRRTLHPRPSHVAETGDLR